MTVCSLRFVCFLLYQNPRAFYYVALCKDLVIRYSKGGKIMLSFCSVKASNNPVNVTAMTYCPH